MHRQTHSRQVVTLVFAVLIGSASPVRAAAPTDADVVAAYHYLLARLLVLRQEHLDFQQGFRWNEIVHRAPGGVTWANPNLDVTYSEAWIAVDDTSCTLVDVPPITGRYYTVQALNGWGETVANVNERTYPEHPSGAFAFCLRGAKVALPAGTQRIDLPGRKARLLVRVELGADPAEAMALQHRFSLRATGAPAVDAPARIVRFPNDKLPGAEAFDTASAVLASEPDVSPGMERLQAKARAIAAAVTHPTERRRIDQVIRRKAIPQFMVGLQRLGTTRNGWNRPATIGNYGTDYLTRSLVDLAGIWANNAQEVVYFKTSTDGAGRPLNGSTVYTMKFPEGEPERLVRYFWSVIAVDPVRFQVIANPLGRHLLNTQSKLERNPDGTLTLWFADTRPASAPEANWLPTPAGQGYDLTFRFYGPIETVVGGGYFPPPLVSRR